MNQSKMLLTLVAVSSLALAPLHAAQPGPDEEDFSLPQPANHRLLTDHRTGVFYGSIVNFIFNLLNQLPLDFEPAANNHWQDVIRAANMAGNREQNIINTIKRANLFKFLDNEQLVQITETEGIPQELCDLAEITLILRTPKKRKATFTTPMRLHHHDSSDDEGDDSMRRVTRRLFEDSDFQAPAPSAR